MLINEKVEFLTGPDLRREFTQPPRKLGLGAAGDGDRYNYYLQYQLLTEHLTVNLCSYFLTHWKTQTRAQRL